MKLNLVVQLISSVVALSLFILYIDILEIRDQGYWWAPMVAGTIMGLSMFLIYVTSNNYYREKYSDDENE